MKDPIEGEDGLEERTHHKKLHISLSNIFPLFSSASSLRG